MSKIRRKLLTLVGDTWKEIARVTTLGLSTITISGNYSHLGFFIVGGGGSGHGDFSSACWSGSGGNGGCVNHFIVPYTINECIISVGYGAIGGQSKKNSNNGEASSVTYNNTTYTSDGGYGGSNDGSINQRQENSGLGGTFRWGGYDDEEMYEWCATHVSIEKYKNTNTVGSRGENGLNNLFDLQDNNLYGAGGSAGQCAYAYGSYYKGPSISGGITGGGNGGWGADNVSYNRGQNATFYGGGGGGGAFSSNHTYSQGGDGYQGIVIIYGK